MIRLSIPARLLSLAVCVLSATAHADPPPPEAKLAREPSARADARPGKAAPAPDSKYGALFHAHSALGVTHGRFVNHLVGAALELRFAPRFDMDLGASYANLSGKAGRVSNVLPEVGLRYLLRLRGGFGLPFRFAGGYLPANGPTLRASAGVEVELTDRVALSLNPAEAMIWVTRNRPELSVNASAALSTAF
jgi:hypothetical protein